MPHGGGSMDELGGNYTWDLRRRALSRLPDKYRSVSIWAQVSAPPLRATVPLCGRLGEAPVRAMAAVAAMFCDHLWCVGAGPGSLQRISICLDAPPVLSCRAGMDGRLALVRNVGSARALAHQPAKAPNEVRHDQDAKFASLAPQHAGQYWMPRYDFRNDGEQLAFRGGNEGSHDQ